MRITITTVITHIYVYKYMCVCIYIYRRRRWHPTPVLLPGKFHGRRSLVGCSPWGRKESDTTEWLHFPFSLSYIGKGNGNPLQCSCLENPSDGRAWWAAVYGVSQSRTRLMWLSLGSGVHTLNQGSQPSLYLAIIWEALKIPDFQASLQTTGFLNFPRWFQRAGRI